MHRARGRNALLLAGLLLDPVAVSKLLQLPLKERVKAPARVSLTLHGTLISDEYALALVRPGQQLSVELERAGAPYVLEGQLE